jgi:hypothetical protein
MLGILAVHTARGEILMFARNAGDMSRLLWHGGAEVKPQSR